MANGIVTTARGFALNLDQLIMQGNRPVGRAAKSTRRSNNYKPNVLNKPKVRGFVPTVGETGATVADVVEVAEATTVVKGDKITSSYSKDNEAKTVTDMTGIKVTKPTRKKASAPVDQVEQKRVEEDEELGNLLDQIETKSDE